MSVIVLPLQIKPYNIYVTVAYPPDTDTPGLAEENKTKVNIFLAQYIITSFHFYLPHILMLFLISSQPLETKLIAETSGVCQPDQVAKIIVRDAVVRNPVNLPLNPPSFFFFPF